jgi:hypothetical protein
MNDHTPGCTIPTNYCDAAVWVGRTQKMEPDFYCALRRGHAGDHLPLGQSTT